MINLLPPNQKKEIIQEEKGRMFLIFGFLMIVFLTSFVLSLLVAKTLLVKEAKIQKIMADSQEQGFQSSQAQNLEKEIESANQILGELNSFYENQIKPSELLEKISQILPKGLYLTSFSFTSPLVSLQGFSPSRELLSELKRAMEKEPFFKELYFPPDIWTKPKDIKFSISFQIGK